MDHAVSIVKYDIILPVVILRIVMVITVILSHEEVCCLRKVANRKIEKLFFEAFLSI